MKKITQTLYLVLSTLLVFALALPSHAHAEGASNLRAAYVKDGQLWIKHGSQDNQLTKEKGISNPLWSPDGTKVSYVKNDKDLYVYDVQTNSHQFIASDVRHVQWSPSENVIAYQIQTVLTVRDLRGKEVGSIQNAAFGVGNYSWVPEGDGFLVSSEAHLLPNGWTNVHLFKVLLNEDYSRKQIKYFYTLPKTLKFGNVNLMAIGTSTFKWSADRKWIAFNVNATASISADSNMLVVLSNDAKKLLTLGEVLYYPEWFTWAPAVRKLAFIQGGGRFSTQNKNLTVQSPPSKNQHVFTPNGYVDVDLTWVWSNNIIVARSKESTSTESFQLYPSLYLIKNDKNQNQITNPPAGFGDFKPEYHMGVRKISWVRTNDDLASVYIANRDGSNSEVWIEKIDPVASYYGHSDWSRVIDIR